MLLFLVSTSTMSKRSSSLISAPTTDANSNADTSENPASLPVVIINDYYEEKKKKAKPRQQRMLRPESSRLLDDMLHPLPLAEFLQSHFRKNAVCVQRRPRSSQPQDNTVKQIFDHPHADDRNSEIVSYICHKYLFDLNIRQLFAHTSSENVFLWLRTPSTAMSPITLNSVEISDPDTAYSLHASGSHPAYCRAPPDLEQLLVGSLLRSTGMGAGHYHPPNAEVTTLGAGRTLGRGEVELFIGTKGGPIADDSGKNQECTGTHTTGAHTDFQENFTIQLSGIKQWTLRRGRVRHPLRATTPHYCREAGVVENQLKMARLCCMTGDNCSDFGNYGFEYNDTNAHGTEQTITLHPGDVLYFPSGMWHTVKTIEPGVSLNVSLMGTTYASLTCEALQHLLVGSDERWREVVVSRPGEVNGANRLQELLKDLSKVVDEFVSSRGGAANILPPALCYPPLEFSHDGDDDEHDENHLLAVDNESRGDEATESDGSLEGDDVQSAANTVKIDMDRFKGPPGWVCEKPPRGKIIKNPLATIIAMEDIAPNSCDIKTDSGEEITRNYLLNVNYAGNELCESHIRIILETSRYIDLMDEYLRGGDSIFDSTPPECLFYYGLFSWSF